MAVDTLLFTEWVFHGALYRTMVGRTARSAGNTLELSHLNAIAVDVSLDGSTMVGFVGGILMLTFSCQTQVGVSNQVTLSTPVTVQAMTLIAYLKKQQLVI